MKQSRSSTRRHIYLIQTYQIYFIQIYICKKRQPESAKHRRIFMPIWFAYLTILPGSAAGAAALNIYIYTLQVNDLVKLGLLTLMIRTYYYLIGTYFYLDLVGGIVFPTSFDQFFDWFLSVFWWLWVVSWSHFWWFMIYHVYMIMYDSFTCGKFSPTILQETK